MAAASGGELKESRSLAVSNTPTGWLCVDLRGGANGGVSRQPVGHKCFHRMRCRDVRIITKHTHTRPVIDFSPFCPPLSLCEASSCFFSATMSVQDISCTALEHNFLVSFAEEHRNVLLLLPLLLLLPSMSCCSSTTVQEKELRYTLAGEE